MSEARGRHVRLEALIAACSVALFAPLTWPLFTGRIFPLTDLGSFHLPVRAIYRDALHAGSLPIWTPSLFAGFYLHGEGQTGMLHPLHLLLYRLLPLGIAFNLEFLASYVAAFAGMYWWLRRLELTRAAALFGALLFAFSGFQLLHFLHMNMVAVSAHIPALLAAIDLVVRSDRPRSRAVGVVIVACVFASAALVGFPQALWWNLLAVGWFAPLRAFELSRVRRLVPCAFALVCGALMGAMQVLPTLDLMQHSVRTEYTRSFALMYSLHPYNLLQLWSPYVFAGRGYGAADYPWVHELAIYSGAILIVALPWLWARRRTLRQSRTLLAGLSVFALVMLVLGLGRYGYVDIALTYLPVIGSLRAPGRYILLTQLALAALAAIAFDDLASLAGPWKPRPGDGALIGVPLLLSVLTAALVSTHLLMPSHVNVAPIGDALSGVGIVAFVSGCVLLAASGRRWALALLVIITAADLGLSGFSYVYGTPPQTVEWLTGGIPEPPAPLSRYATPADWGNRLLLKHYRLAVGYAGLFPLTALSYARPEFQRLAGVRGTFQADASLTWRHDAVDRVRLLTDVRVSTDHTADIGLIDLRKTALVSEALPAMSGAPGTATLAADRPGRIVVDTNAPSSQLLSVGERYDTGWSATLDGRPLRVLRINGDFIGCLVDPGAHRVELTFAPRSFSAGLIASAAGLVALACGAFVIARGERV